MNSLQFLQSINDIDEEYIANAYKERKKQPVITGKNIAKLSACAACIAVIFIATSMWSGATQEEIDMIPTTAPTATGAPAATGAPLYSYSVNVSDITNITDASEVSFAISSTKTENYQSLQEGQVEAFYNLLNLEVNSDEPIYMQNEDYQLLTENAIYFYAGESETLICFFDNYIEIIQSADSSVVTGIYQLSSQNDIFSDILEIFVGE